MLDTYTLTKHGSVAVLVFFHLDPSTRSPLVLALIWTVILVFSTMTRSATLWSTWLAANGRHCFGEMEHYKALSQKLHKKKFFFF